MSNCLSPQASGTAACRRRTAADGHAIAAAASAPHHNPTLLVPVVAAAAPAASRAPSPRPHQHHHHQQHQQARAIILHPRHAYRLPRPLPVVLPPPAAPRTPHHHPSFGRLCRGPSSLSAALPLDALTAVAERLGDGRSLAAFAATCRACKAAAYDERLWRRECERRFGPIMAQPPAPQGGVVNGGSGGGGGNGSSGSGSGNSNNSTKPFSWRRLYAFNAHAYDAVMAATREAERARAMTRLLGASAARRWMGGRAALGMAA